MRAYFLLAAVCLFAANAYAEGEALTKDLGVQGLFRYCRYADGKVLGIDANRSCPAQKPYIRSGSGTGYLKKEMIDATGKQCVYRVGGEDKATRVAINTSCPLNQQF